MPRLKRKAEEEADPPIEQTMAPETASTLKDLRNMWEFASLMQYIFLFGNAVKIDEDFDIEVRALRQPVPKHSGGMKDVGVGRFG